MPFGSDLCRMGFSADQAADVMRTVRPDQRELFLRNFETLISLPLPFDQVGGDLVRAGRLGDSHAARRLGRSVVFSPPPTYGFVG
jgi:hypothetical protein